MHNRYIVDLKNIDPQNIHQAGGKGASLGKLSKLGVNTPKGFIIFSGIFESFMESNNFSTKIKAIIAATDFSDFKSIQISSNNITSLITNGIFEKEIEEYICNIFEDQRLKRVIVRSSATAEDTATNAWAGQLESYLNITKRELIHSIKLCWASLYSSRALQYAKLKGLLNETISVAVVVQEMEDTEISGIAFSVHPILLDKNKLVIEAAYGLCDAIVSGHVSPDTYIVDKKTSKVIEKDISVQTRKFVYQERANKANWVHIDEDDGEKQKLSDKEIINLTRITINLEKRYKRPLDIEWGIKDSIIYIFQVRPITTIKPSMLE